MEKTITIRPVSVGDDTQVKDLIVGIVEKEFPPEERDFLSSDIESVSKNYSREGESFFVACQDRKIVGTVGIKREDERNAMLRRIFVRPEFRGQKIGYQLIQRAIQFCKEKGYEEIIFKTTSRMQNAIALCEANGFAKKATIRLGDLDLFKFAICLDKNHGNNHRAAAKKQSR